MWVAAQVKRRIERETTRPDFMTLILANNRDKGAKLSQAEIDSNSFFLMNAGSETTATALSGVTYHLLRNVTVLRKLQDEIRGKFATYDEITLAAVNDAPYLIATLSEGLRTFPPAAAGFGRVSPKGGELISGYYIPEGTVVSVSHHAAYRSERNFKNPNSFVPERWSVIPVPAPTSSVIDAPRSLGWAIPSTAMTREMRANHSTLALAAAWATIWRTPRCASF